MQVHAREHIETATIMETRGAVAHEAAAPLRIEAVGR